MNWRVKRIGTAALVAIGAATLTIGPARAVVGRAADAPSFVKVTFVVKGDLKSFEGRLHDSNCVDQVQPNPFRVFPGDAFPVGVQTRPPTPLDSCYDRNEVIWLIVTQPRSGKDAPETMGVRLRYGARRPTQVAFLHASKDLRWTDHILAPDRVEVVVTGM
jgi:hypothetical protein